jgi:hypothetical protein
MMRTFAIACVALLAACSGAGLRSLVPPEGSSIQGTAGSVLAKPARNAVRVCPPTTRPDEVRCFAIVRTDTPRRFGLQAHDATIAGFGPGQLQAAYGLPVSTAGKGQTIAIVDAFDDPNAESDLAIYRKQFGIPAYTKTNGCFRQLSETGSATGLPVKNAAWAQEESLDLDMVSAICPNCHIILLEAASTTARYQKDLGIAEDTAVALGANVVSNSYGTGEYGATNAAFAHAGHVLVASAGDSGTGAAQPCSFATVVCVGGTSLVKAKGRYAETAWSGTGSGCSALVAKPVWQSDAGCSMRSEADTSAVADPETGVAVYDSVDDAGQKGWLVMGGTSTAAPIVAGIYALGGTAKSLNVAESIWSAGGSSALSNVTTGSNGTCAVYYICHAGKGYNGPTGWGTPNGVAAFSTPPVLSAKNLYVANGENNTVAVFGPNGLLRTITAGIAGPSSLAFDRSGNLAVANSGSVTEYAPGKTAVLRTIPLSGAHAVAFDAVGDLYATAGSTVRVYDAGTTTLRRTISGFQSAFALAFAPHGGNLYVADNQGNAVAVYAPGGTSPLLTISDGLDLPFAMAFDGSDNVFVSNGANNSITEYAPGSAALAQTLYDPNGGPGPLAFDKSGNLFVGNLGNGSVAVYTTGSVFPAFSITDGISGPYSLVTNGNELLVGNQSSVTIYVPPGTSTISTLTQGISYADSMIFGP